MAFASGFSVQAQFSPVENALNLLRQFGFFQVVLPILLIFAIFYGILLKTKLFGDPEKTEQPWSKPVSAIVSFVAAFFVVSSTEVVENINILLPQSAFVILIGVLLLMLLVMFGAYSPETTLSSGWAKAIVAGIIIFVFLGVVDTAFGISIPIIHQLVGIFLGTSSSGTISSDAIATLVAILLVIGIPAGVIYWFTR